MNSEYLYVFYGWESEYSVGPLAAYMQDKGYRVIEINYRNQDVREILYKIRGEKIVFITSWHLGADAMNEKRANKTIDYMKLISPLEVMDFLRPIKTVYYPHDLGCLIGVNEDKWIDLFDVVLFPYECNEFYNTMNLCNEVYNVGWIKKKDTTCAKKEEFSGIAVYFPSNWPMAIAKMGFEGYAKHLASIVGKNIPIKMSTDIDSLKVIESLKELGCKVLNPETNIYDVLNDYKYVIGNGDSSIIYEAMYSGALTISILDGFMPDSTYKAVIPHMNSLFFLHPDEVTEFLKDKDLTFERREDVLLPLDYEKVESILNDKLEVK